MSFDISQYAGAGTENLDESSSMPLLNIIQSNSPQLIKQKDQFIEGASTGDIFYTPTQEVVDQPIRFTPSAFKTVYVEWKPRPAGGFVGYHPLTIVSHPAYEQGRDPAKPYKEHLGPNDLEKTTYVLGTIEINGVKTPAMVALKSSGQRVARKIQGDIRKFRYEDNPDMPPPVFARSWELTAKYEESNDGDGYYNWDFGNPQVLDFESDVELLEAAADLLNNAGGMLPTPSIAPSTEKPALTVDDDTPY